MLLAFGLWAVAPSAQPISRERFVDAYVACNNRAWAGVSHELIPFAREGRRGADAQSAAVRGFLRLGYAWGDQVLREPHAPATLGWAAATKAFADDGGIETRFRVPATARAYLRGQVGQDVGGLGQREIASLATNLHLARLAGRPHDWVLDGFAGTSFAARLDIAQASRLLRSVGSHESVGNARTAPLSVRPCSERDARDFLQPRIVQRGSRRAEAP